MSHEERSPKGEHRSAPVLCKEDCATRRKLAALYGYEVVEIVDSHEALRAERDAALAEVALLAAECRAERAMDGKDDSNGKAWDALMAARDSVDAAGALEGGRS